MLQIFIIFNFVKQNDVTHFTDQLVFWHSNISYFTR